MAVFQARSRWHVGVPQLVAVGLAWRTSPLRACQGASARSSASWTARSASAHGYKAALTRRPAGSGTVRQGGRGRRSISTVTSPVAWQAAGQERGQQSGGRQTCLAQGEGWPGGSDGSPASSRGVASATGVADHSGVWRHRSVLALLAALTNRAPPGLGGASPRGRMPCQTV